MMDSQLFPMSLKMRKLYNIKAFSVMTVGILQLPNDHYYNLVIRFFKMYSEMGCLARIDSDV